MEVENNRIGLIAALFFKLSQTVALWNFVNSGGFAIFPSTKNTCLLNVVFLLTMDVLTLVFFSLPHFLANDVSERSSQPFYNSLIFDLTFLFLKGCCFINKLLAFNSFLD